MKASILLAWAVLFLLPGCVTETTYVGKNSERMVHGLDKQAAAKSRLELGLGYLRKGSMSQAKYNLDRAQALDPSNTDVYLAQAYYFQQVGDPVAAEESYRQLLALDGRNADGHNNYGVFLCERGNYGGAEQHFQAALAEPGYTKMADTYENAAVCALKAGNKLKAVEYYRRAFGYNPGSTRILLSLAALQLDTGKTADTEATMARYGQMGAKESAQSLWLRLRLAKAMDQLAQLHKLGGELVRQFPHSDQAKRYLNNDY